MITVTFYRSEFIARLRVELTRSEYDVAYVKQVRDRALAAARRDGFEKVHLGYTGTKGRHSKYYTVAR